jgi:hypothetical protein
MHLFGTPYSARQTGQRDAEQISAVGNAAANVATSAALQHPNDAGARCLSEHIFAASMDFNTHPVFHNASQNRKVN